jgi:hypothetical protein
MQMARRPEVLLAISDSRRMDGAFMELSGRNRWQPVANGTRSKTAQKGPIRNRWRMVRRGSTVRVRQRASAFLLLLVPSSVV